MFLPTVPYPKPIGAYLRTRREELIDGIVALFGCRLVNASTKHLLEAIAFGAQVVQHCDPTLFLKNVRINEIFFWLTKKKLGRSTPGN